MIKKGNNNNNELLDWLVNKFSNQRFETVLMGWKYFDKTVKRLSGLADD